MADMEKQEKTEEQKPQSAEATEEEVSEAQTAETGEEPVQGDPVEEALESAKAEADELKRKWYSVTAEYENYRKRTANTRAQAYAEGRADVVVKLFPIADNLDRALLSCADEGTKKGIGMVVKSFEKLLQDEKISVIDPVGEEFDAEKCEAIMAVEPAEGEASGIVRQVYLKGYEQNGKVLRFAQVVVTK